jgi:hypothetical protein
MRTLGLLAVLVLNAAIPLRAVQSSDGDFNLANAFDPTSTQITNWDNGWGSAPANTTGWNYVGLLTVPDGYLSGVYLGDGWVLTAGHGGTTLDSYTLDGTTYTPVASSVHTLTTFNDGTGGQADLLMFQLSTIPSTVSLPALTLASGVPVGYNSSTNAAGSDTVIVGYGFPGAAESWGTGSVYQTDGLFSIASSAAETGTFTSVDYDIFNNNSGAPDSSTNLYNLYPGDSGGADFIYNAGSWQLAGINEFVGTYTQGNETIPYVSGFVQVDDYTSQIDAIMAAPEPGTYLLFGIGLGALLFIRKLRPCV